MAYTENGGVRLWWDEIGSGDPVLLIMGFSYPSQMWHRVWPALSEDFRVIRFDNRGVGKSEAPWGAYEVRDMVEDAVAVLDAAGVSRAHIYGASMGGGIAQEFALMHPERVMSLVLACTAAPGPPEGKPAKIPAFLHVIPPKLFLRRMSRVRNGYGPDVPQSIIDEDRDILMKTRQPARGVIGQAKAVAAYRSRDRVHAITAPTLVIHGDADKTVPVEMGRELASLIPGSRLEIIERGGHNFINSVDGEANRLVKEFFLSAPRAQTS